MAKTKRTWKNLPSASELRPLTALQQELSHLFPSMGSVQWELRQYRERYVQAGAVFEIGGRILAHPETFKKVAIDIGAEKIAARSGRAKAA